MHQHRDRRCWLASMVVGMRVLCVDGVLMWSASAPADPLLRSTLNSDQDETGPQGSLPCCARTASPHLQEGDHHTAEPGEMLFHLPASAAPTPSVPAPMVRARARCVGREDAGRASNAGRRPDTPHPQHGHRVQGPHVQAAYTHTVPTMSGNEPARGGPPLSQF
jgi:hypothetical protein